MEEVLSLYLLRNWGNQKFRPVSAIEVNKDPGQYLRIYCIQSHNSKRNILLFRMLRFWLCQTFSLHIHILQLSLSALFLAGKTATRALQGEDCIRSVIVNEAMNGRRQRKENILKRFKHLLPLGHTAYLYLSSVLQLMQNYLYRLLY